MLQIHIWALAHVVCRPIVVVPMEEPLDLSQMDARDAAVASERPAHIHHYEGIYLPVLWGSQPASRSPLIIGHQNGLFYALVISDGNHGFSRCMFALFVCRNLPARPRSAPLHAHATPSSS